MKNKKTSPLKEMENILKKIGCLKKDEVLEHPQIYKFTVRKKGGEEE